MNFYKTSNGLELLTDWAGDCHDYKTYNKNKQRAREAAGALLHSGNLIFEHGNIPRNSSEFVANMPYTSTSDFAALWATCAYCAHQIKNRQTKLYLVGIALTDAQAVSVWRDCESNYIFEIVGEEPKAQPIILNTDSDIASVAVDCGNGNIITYEKANGADGDTSVIIFASYDAYIKYCASRNIDTLHDVKNIATARFNGANICQSDCAGLHGEKEIPDAEKVYTLSGRFAIKAKDDAVYFVKIEE